MPYKVICRLLLRRLCLLLQTSTVSSDLYMYWLWKCMHVFSMTSVVFWLTASHLTSFANCSATHLKQNDWNHWADCFQRNLFRENKTVRKEYGKSTLATLLSSECHFKWLCYERVFSVCSLRGKTIQNQNMLSVHECVCQDLVCLKMAYM